MHSVSSNGIAPQVSSDENADSSAQPAGAAFSRALTQGLDRPLSALRASMEALGQELAESGVPPLRIHGVLREVERLADNVRDLCAFATPPVPRALSCSLQEILAGARAQLAPALKARVLVARLDPEERPALIEVDGPLLCDCLRRLIENALESGSEHVLLLARLEQGNARFSVIDAAPRGFDPDWAVEAFHTTKPNHLGLGLALTRRDVELLGGELEFLATPDSQCARITVPAGRVRRSRPARRVQR
jgi:two-component system C4-dicarboxylate transport sensor histidine kinase DctB